MLLSRNSQNTMGDPYAYYAMLASAGWQAVDINETIPEKFFDDMDAESVLRTVLDAIHRAGLVVGQCHAPMPWPLTEMSAENKEYRIQQMQQCIRLADKLNIPFTVVHPIVYSWQFDDPDAVHIREINAEYLYRLLQVAENTVICLENMPSKHGVITNGEQMKDMLKLIGDDRLMVCLDTGHLFSVDGKVSDFFASVGDRIRALHIHDTISGQDRHMLPRTGSGDWSDFTQALRDYQYQGTLNSECTFAYRFPMKKREYWESVECAAIASLHP